MRPFGAVTARFPGIPWMRASNPDLTHTRPPSDVLAPLVHAGQAVARAHVHDPRQRRRAARDARDREAAGGQEPLQPGPGALQAPRGNSHGHPHQRPGLRGRELQTEQYRPTAARPYYDNCTEVTMGVFDVSEEVVCVETMEKYGRTGIIEPHHPKRGCGKYPCMFLNKDPPPKRGLVDAYLREVEKGRADTQRRIGQQNAEVIMGGVDEVTKRLCSTCSISRRSHWQLTKDSGRIAILGGIAYHLALTLRFRPRWPFSGRRGRPAISGER